MDHSFNVEIATKYGIEESIILGEIAYNIEANIQNYKNFYDGYFWVCRSASAFNEMFPYINERKVSRVLKNLENLGVIKSGNFNLSTYDRTKWYTIIDDHALMLLT